MAEQTSPNEIITLDEATKNTPGRPSAHCLWRWCRKGVLSRGGERIRLEHVRIGGKIYTKLQWLEEFGRKLAESDTQYFNLCEAAAAEAVANTPRRRRTAAHEEQRRKHLEEVERELDEAGI